MHPTMVLAGHQVPSYIVLLCVALIVGTAVAVALGPRIGIVRPKALLLALASIAFGYLGAKGQSIVLETGLDRWLARGSLKTGLAVQGGLLLGGLALVATARLTRLRWTDALDLGAPAAALAMVFGRAGCLLAGCCWGRPTLFPIALVFSDFNASARPIGVPLHATQVYEAAGCGLIFVFLVLYRLPRRRFSGHLVCDFALLYGVLRFTLEHLRADPRGPVVWGMSTPQLLALAGIVAVGLVHLWRTVARPLPARAQHHGASGPDQEP